MRKHSLAMDSRRDCNRNPAGAKMIRRFYRNKFRIKAAYRDQIDKDGQTIKGAVSWYAKLV